LSRYRLGRHSVTDNDGYGDHDGDTLFNGYSESVAYINILRRTTPQFPTMTSIRFSDQATSLVATFDIPTNVPGTVTGATGFPRSLSSCDVIIDLTTSTSPYIALLGTTPTPTCAWTSEQTLEIVLGSDATVVPGSIIALRVYVLVLIAYNCMCP
jgi:hypothetical protein